MTPSSADEQQLAAARKAGNLTETFVQLGLRDWPSLLQHHLGYAVLAALGLLVALLTPLVGERGPGFGRVGLILAITHAGKPVGALPPTVGALPISGHHDGKFKLHY